jgi:hypothetical protein
MKPFTVCTEEATQVYSCLEVFSTKIGISFWHFGTRLSSFFSHTAAHEKFEFEISNFVNACRILSMKLSSGRSKLYKLYKDQVSLS